MSEPPSKPAPPGQESIDRRAWSRATQLRVAGSAAAAFILILLCFWLGGRLLGKRETGPAELPAPAGTFRATALQLKAG